DSTGQVHLIKLDAIPFRSALNLAAPRVQDDAAHKSEVPELPGGDTRSGAHYAVRSNAPAHSSSSEVSIIRNEGPDVFMFKNLAIDLVENSCTSENIVIA